MRLSDTRGFWILLTLLVTCWGASARLAAQDAVATQDSFAGTKAGQQRGLFCWCPPGKFTMGSPANEAGRFSNEAQVEVTLTHGFWMGKYEVTQAQFQAVMDENPSGFKGAFAPVEDVTWNQAVKFCQKLTASEHQARRLPQGWEYRLPTEAQWEYACRAGTKTRFSFGDDEKQLGDYAWYRDNSSRATHPVGEKKPNPWGLCDMHGNVWEWCRDWFHDKLPGGTDPEVTQGSERVGRGGSWYDSARGCRSANRGGFGPSGLHLGFRVAAVQSSQPAGSQ